MPQFGASYGGYCPAQYDYCIGLPFGGYMGVTGIIGSAYMPYTWPSSQEGSETTLEWLGDYIITTLGWATESGSPGGSGGAARQAQQNPCTQPILSGVNSQFGANATPNDVQGGPFTNGQATNLNIMLTGLPAAQFNSIQPGRYPLNWWTYLIGYGPIVHVTGPNFFNPNGTFNNSNIGGLTSVTFTVHIDYGFVLNPFGALYHLIREVLHIGGPRKPC
jgi:hypothetical protein